MADKVELKCEGFAGNKKRSSTVVQMCRDLAASMCFIGPHFEAVLRPRDKPKWLTKLNRSLKEVLAAKKGQAL